MGFFKDLGDIKRQAKRLEATSDSGSRLRQMNEQLTALNASMAPPAAPAGPYAAPTVYASHVHPLPRPPAV